MIKRATSGVFVVLLLAGLYMMNLGLAVKAQTASPSEAVITVSGVPSGTSGLAVEVTVDTSVVTLSSSASSSVSGALAVVGSISESVGIISTSGELPASFTITVPFTGVTEGMSSVVVGQVLDMLGGTPITGASATVDVNSVTIGSSSSSSTSSSGGGPGGNLSADTFTVTIDGDALAATNALNVTISFSDPNAVQLDSGVTFMGTGASQLLTDVDTMTNVLTVVWDGTISDNRAVITGMLKAGTQAGTSTISVGKVEASGANDITTAVIVTVDPSTVTNSSSSSTDLGTFTFIGPDSVTGPGKAAFAFSVSGATGSLSATLNGNSVTFDSGQTAGIAIVDLPASGDLDLSLVVNGSTTVDLGTVTVDAGSGKAPKVTRAFANNKSSGTKLTVTGRRLKNGTATVIPESSDRIADSSKATGKKVKVTFPTDECIPSGSFVNVSTAGGTAAKKVSVKGSCTHPLVE